MGGWVLGLIVLFGALSVTGSDFTGDPEPPASKRVGLDILQEHFDGPTGGFGGSIVFQAEQGVDDPEVVAAMEDLFAIVDERDGFSLLSPYGPLGRFQIAQEGELAGKLAFARVQIEEDIEWAVGGRLGADLIEAVPDIDGLRVEIGGEPLSEFQPPESELIGIAFAIVVLILSFGSVVAMGLPIAVAVAGVAGGVAVAGMVSNLIDTPSFAPQIAAMIGLGVGIDYALFVITRFREHLHEGERPDEAVGTAMDTAGRAVVFAGMTVVVSLFGMALMGLEFVTGLGLAAAVTVLMTMLASTTLLPALLGFVGVQVELSKWRGLIAAGFVSVALLGQGLGVAPLLVGAPLAVVTIVASFFVPALRRQVPRREPKVLHETGWHRWSLLIQRRPWPFAIGGTLVLLTLTVPVLGLRLGFSDEGNYPEDSTTRQAYDLLAEGFGPGFNGPLVAVTEVGGLGGLAELEPIAAGIAADPGVAFVTPWIPNDPLSTSAAMLQIIPTSAPQDEATEATVKRLRDEVLPALTADRDDRVHLTGFVVVSMDMSDFMGERSPVFFAVVLLVSFVLLTAVFRSLLVPLKAVIMNMLSIGAAYGAVVALFQWGWLSDFTGIEPAPIEPFIPMMMFAIVFGLSMDYEVFLLSRIKERYVRTGDAFTSVADGLSATARVISAAAAIMVVVFGAFLLEDARALKVMGTGLSLAVFFDATLVRMLLVPATMELLGERNWWIPRWLDRVLPQLNVEGTHHVDDDLVTVAPGVDDEPTLVGSTSD